MFLHSFDAFAWVGRVCSVSLVAYYTFFVWQVQTVSCLEASAFGQAKLGS